MQVKEIHNDTEYGRGMCNYDDDDLSMQCFFDKEWSELEIKDSVILEISFQADKISFNFGYPGTSAAGTTNFEAIEPRDMFHDEKMKTAILAKIVEHIDNLLQDWFPDLGESRFNQTCLGRYLVTRVIPCPLCMEAEIRFQAASKDTWNVVSNDMEHEQPLSISGVHVSIENNREETAEAYLPNTKRVISCFLVEKCIKNVLDGKSEICKVHKAVSPQFMPGEDGVMMEVYVAPDAVSNHFY